jgi:hypothetical protein
LTPHRPGESLFKPRKRVGAGKSTVGYPEAIICQKTFYETINYASKEQQKPGCG